MNDSVVKRPPILAGACFYLGLLSTIMAVRAITVVSTWNGDDRAADFADTLRAMRDAGLSASGAETTYKSIVTVIAVLAAAGAVFAVFTARGDRSSRVGMTVVIAIAGFLTFLGLLGGTFFLAMLGALAVAFTARLWTGEIRTYFRALAGHPPASADAPPAAPRVDPFADPSARPGVTSVMAPPQQAPTQQGPQQPAPSDDTAVQTQPAHPTWGAQPGQQPWPVTPPPGRESLPTSVSIAVWTTFIGSLTATGLSAIMLLAILVLGVDYDSVVARGGPGVDMIRGSESDFDTAMRFILVISSISVALGIGGLLAAVRVLVTRRSGDVLLFVMTVVTIMFSVIAFPLGLPWTVAAIVALVQLRRPDSKRWFVKT